MAPNTYNMHNLSRRQPSLDLRKAARMAELATKHEIEQFTLEDGLESMYRSETSKENRLKMSTSSPILSAQYQSDEEQPSPRTEDFDYEESGMSEYASCVEDDDDDLDFDGDDEEMDQDLDYSSETRFISSGLAIAIPIQSLRPNIVDITTLAPMAKRTCRISRPLSASFATFIRVKAPSPTTIRTSIYSSSMPQIASQEEEAETDIQNFNTQDVPRTNSLSPPGSLHSGTSPSSSCLSLSNGSFEEGDALIRESDEIQMRQTVLAGTEWDDQGLASPTPTSWAAYDPFALAVPTLSKGITPSVTGSIKQRSGWKRLGLKTKILAAGRRAGWN